MDRIKHFLENGVRSNKAMAISWSPYRMNQARSKREVNPISKGHVDIVVKGLEEDLICGSPLSGRANGKARFAIFHLPLSFFFVPTIRNVSQKLEIGKFNNNRANEPHEFIQDW